VNARSFAAMAAAIATLGVAFAGAAEDAAARFIGSWEGPANAYDDAQAMQPTNAKLSIRRSADDPKRLIVELTLFGDRLSRFTKCELTDAGELRVRDELLVQFQRVRVEGRLRSLTGKRIEEGLIQFFVETPQGDYRPYYTVKFAAQRAAASAPAPPPK
jgi:hypothetical protein